MLTSFQGDFSEFFEHEQIVFVRKIEEIRNIQSDYFFAINSSIISNVYGYSNLFIILRCETN